MKMFSMKIISEVKWLDSTRLIIHSLETLAQTVANISIPVAEAGSSEDDK